ncbi:hypothetical protein [Acinetobacter wuhouensis]|uniref:TIGR04255 family protein n=1 Tax=Acinetobacter wuhouensis TaxID=1879050 RepID=A0A4Q7AJC9_9GAMM|nr:hypothetical protein [Acinetobacter wuhouensis]RZG48048.1 hypothetical protein EXU28_04575 [Acinetobacter wuhouensis]
MNISSLQFAFFFANPPVNLKFDEFSVSLRKKNIFTDNHLELQTVIFPFPNNAPIPADIPRCQITSSDQKFNLTISGARCDIQFRASNSNSVETFNNILMSIIELLASFEVEITRIGYVTEYIIIHPNPDLIIKEKFLNIDQKDLCDPFIRFVIKTVINETTYNDVYQIQTATQRNFVTGKEDSILLISQDFNTLPEMTKAITTNDLNNFVKNIPQDRIQKYIQMLSE